MIELLHACLVLSGLLLPGLGWALGARWPSPIFAAGVISALAILVGTVGLALSGLGTTLANLLCWLGAVTMAGSFFWWRKKPNPPVVQPPSGRAEWWLLAPLAPMVAVFLWRAWTQPLSGADVDFRWNYLAELMIQTGRLDFYPPFRAPDFVHYFWIDGFVPLLSCLYAWTYQAAGSLDRHWTALPVLMQGAGLMVLLQAMGSLWGGGRGGRLACALAGATFLLSFAFNLGQESGLTALGGGGMIYYLAYGPRESRCVHWVPAALCGALAACAREYGLAFPLAGAAGMLILGAGFKRTLSFVIVAVALPLAWYGRNWELTGNPFYSLDVAGLFPVNRVFALWMAGYRETYGQPFHQLAGWTEIARLLAISALPALLGFAVGAWFFRRQSGWLIAMLTGGAATAAWIASVPFTAGGMFYSMRVLSPLLVLGCAWGGAALSGLITRSRHLALLCAGLFLWGTEAALRTLTVPINPYRVTPGEWSEAGYTMQRDFAEKDRPFLLAVAAQGRGKVLSESAGAQRIFRAVGREVVPLWSPEVDFLFDPHGDPNAAARLRGLGYTHVLLTRVQSSVEFLRRTGALARLNGHLQSVMANDNYVLFELIPGDPK